MMKHLIFTIALLLSCFPSALSSNASGTAQATSATQADVDELKDVVDAANLLIYFKAYMNSSEVIEDSNFGSFLTIIDYQGPKEYAFQETRSAETVWYKNCTLKRNSPLPQTYAKGTTSIVSLESSMGGGMTVYLSVFNEKAAHQVKCQLQRLDVKVSENYDDPEADVYFVYDQSSKRWVMSCNSFSDFITRDAENPKPYLTAKFLPSIVNYVYCKTYDINFFEGLGFKKVKDGRESDFCDAYCYNNRFNSRAYESSEDFGKWFTPNDKSAIGILDSHYDGWLVAFFFYNKQLFDEMKAKVIEMGFIFSPESEPNRESYVKDNDDMFFSFEQKNGYYQVSVAVDCSIDEEDFQ